MKCLKVIIPCFQRDKTLQHPAQDVKWKLIISSHLQKGGFFI